MAGNDFLTPIIARTAPRKSLCTPGSAGRSLTKVSSIITDNDDEKEKSARRRSHVLDIQSTSSPGLSDKSKRREAIVPQFSDQLDHYAQCIRLATENKITSKNAFSLHLIDYGSNILSKNTDDEVFKTASSVIDASTKIYACRVDNLHAETYKVLSGLGRRWDKSSKDKDSDDDGGGDDEGGGPDGDEEVNDGARVTKKKTKGKKSKTIETNLKNINMKKQDFILKAKNPLFQKASGDFDEGGTESLLLATLNYFNDLSELALDSSRVVINHADDGMQTTGSTLQETIDLNKRYLEDVSSLQPSNNILCPELAAFEFNKQSSLSFNSEVTNQNSSAIPDSHAFDQNAEPEALETLNDVEEDIVTADDFSPDNVVDDAADDDQLPDDLQIGDSEPGILLESAVDSLSNENLRNTMDKLAAEPSYFSYFKKNFFRSSGGPNNWTLLSSSRRGKTDSQNLDKKKKKKGKKESLPIDLDKEVDFDKYFKKTRAATTLIKTTLAKYGKCKNLQTPELRYDGSKLIQLFFKDIMPTRPSVTSDLDRSIEKYDYNNKNDKENFCSQEAPVGNLDDDEDGYEFNLSNDLAESQSQGSLLGDGTEISDRLGNSFLGENRESLTNDSLVPLPKMVNKIAINYAKTETKIDSKLLKAHMWDILIHPEDSSTNQDADESEGQGEKRSRLESSESSTVRKSVHGKHHFSKMYNTLLRKLPENMIQNLSVPIAFNCLLHMANEKVLFLADTEDNNDFVITQGSSPSN